METTFAVRLRARGESQRLRRNTDAGTCLVGRSWHRARCAQAPPQPPRQAPATSGIQEPPGLRPSMPCGHKDNPQGDLVSDDIMNFDVLLVKRQDSIHIEFVRHLLCEHIDQSRAPGHLANDRHSYLNVSQSRPPLAVLKAMYMVVDFQRQKKTRLRAMWCCAGTGLLWETIVESCSR